MSDVVIVKSLNLFCSWRELEHSQQGQNLVLDGRLTGEIESYL